MAGMHPHLRKLLRPFRPLARILRLRRADDVWTARLIDAFVHGDAGTAYGLDAAAKRELVELFQRNARAVASGTAASVHLVLASEILRIPPETPGDVVECGVWKGASSASLSLVCRAARRRLKVCDSFAGLPDDAERRHLGLHTGVYGHYHAGMFAGALPEVRENIERLGAIEVCDFVEGFFAQSLAALRGPVAFAFLDVDLESSTRDCLKALWPLLNDDAFVYTDDAGDLDVVKVFFDEPWWQRELGCGAPGYVGSGCGLPLGPASSSLGYTRKLGPFRAAQWRRAPFLHYPGGAA